MEGEKKVRSGGPREKIYLYYIMKYGRKKVIFICYMPFY